MEGALQIDPTRADCLSLLYQVLWRESKDQQEGINYLNSAIEHKPNWILPRIKLVLFYLYNGDLNSS